MPFTLDNIPPSIPVDSLPEDEKGYAEAINGLLQNLTTYTKDFEAALSLLYQAHKWSKEEMERTRATTLPDRSLSDSLRDWMMLAARDGAMTVWHFGQSKNWINKNLYKCPTLVPKVPTVLLGEGHDLFKQAFPHWENLRHAVAHHAELLKNPAARKKTMITTGYDGPGITIPGGGELYLGRMLMGHRFMNTHEGKVVHYDLSPESLDALKASKAKFWEAFRGVDPWSSFKVGGPS